MSSSPVFQAELERGSILTRPIKRGRYLPWLYGPIGGAVVAALLTFGYALVFIVYAILRSALLLARVPSDAGVAGTLAAYAVSLGMSSLTIAAMMAIPAVIVGLITAFIVKRSLSLFNPENSAPRALVVGALTCVVIAAIFHVVAQRALGFSLSGIASNLETYLYWLGFPSAIYIVAGAVMSWRLNAHRKENIL